MMMYSSKFFATATRPYGSLYAARPRPISVPEASRVQKEIKRYPPAQAFHVQPRAARRKPFLAFPGCVNSI